MGNCWGVPVRKTKAMFLFLCGVDKKARQTDFRNETVEQRIKEMLRFSSSCFNELHLTVRGSNNSWALEKCGGIDPPEDWIWT